MLDIELFFNKLFLIVLSHADMMITFGLIFLLLEYLFPAQRDASDPSKSMLCDFANSFLLVIAAPFFIGIPVYFAHWFLENILNLQSLSLFGENFYLQLFISIFLVDFVGYWRHRFMHWKFMWPIHAIHHSSTSLNWVSLDRFHIFNHVITLSLNMFVLTLLFDPACAVVSLYMRRVYGQFIHANVRAHFGPLNIIFVSPLFHHWHHSCSKEAMNKNYSTVFSLFDYMFNTFYLPKDNRFPKDLGIEDELPANLCKQFIYPFKKWRRALRYSPQGK